MLPIPRPARTITAGVPYAYTDGPITIASRRPQPSSNVVAATPDNANAIRTRNLITLGEKSVIPDDIAAAAYGISGRFSALMPAANAATPTRTFTVAANATAEVNPTVGSTKYTVATTPKAAPSMFHP